MKYDLIVIGGGPSGMMAAGKASEGGAKVLLLEKNPSLGKKLLLTGNGRCNLTNEINNIGELIRKFGPNGKFLYNAFNFFGPDETIAFFEKRGVKTKKESDGRVFPASDKAEDVLNCLLCYLKKTGTEIMYGAEVNKIVFKNRKIEKAVLKDGRQFVADNYLFSTGGLSYPLTGSTGDAYGWLKKMGHKITDLSPALCAIKVKEKFVKKLEGLSLKDIEISVYQKNKKIKACFGEAIFTSVGLSGPMIFDLSFLIGKALKSGEVFVKIDFAPSLDFKKIDGYLLKLFQSSGKKMLKNVLSELLPQKIILVIIELLGIDQEKKAVLISGKERKKIIHFLKEFVFEVAGLAGYSRAIVTSGGVELGEVDPKTMKSKIIDNLYLVGEVLDIDGPTGGYNLQNCWSSGQIAGANWRK